MPALYNEIHPYPAQWLENLIAVGAIADGRVECCDVRDLELARVRRAVQFHAFAGIGAWSHALRLAGWPDDRPVWTASLPCQPFSNAGPKKGIEDDRHLWPAYFRLVEECRPLVIFGEQAASDLGLAWLDAVSGDLERAGYAIGAIDSCAAIVGAPHLRQRLYFAAVDTRGDHRIVGNARGHRAGQHAGELRGDESQHGVRSPYRLDASELAIVGRYVSGPWRDCEWIRCGDPAGDRWRPVTRIIPVGSSDSHRHGGAARLRKLDRCPASGGSDPRGDGVDRGGARGVTPPNDVPNCRCAKPKRVLENSHGNLYTIGPVANIEGCLTVVVDGPSGPLILFPSEARYRTALRWRMRSQEFADVIVAAYVEKGGR